jgi:hypothetical protein
MSKKQQVQQVMQKTLRVLKDLQLEPQCDAFGLAATAAQRPPSADLITSMESRRSFGMPSWSPCDVAASGWVGGEQPCDAAGAISAAAAFPMPTVQM